jgi:hypothetical protein
MRKWLLIVLALVVTAVVVDGLTRSGDDRRTPSHHAASSAPRRSGSLPVRPGAPGSPRAVLYRFATAYGTVSAAGVVNRQRQLVSLAAPPLRSQLRATGPDGRLQPVTRVLRRTNLDELLLGLRLSSQSPDAAHGTVVIEQWPTGPGDSGVAPSKSSYTAEVVRTARGWRVSEFTLRP